MNLVPYLGSAVMLLGAAALVAITHLSMDADGPLFERGKRWEIACQFTACAVAFIAGWQL